MRNSSKTICFRSTLEVDRQLEWLSVYCGENKSRVIQRAIDFYYHTVRNTEHQENERN